MLNTITRARQSMQGCTVGTVIKIAEPLKIRYANYGIAPDIVVPAGSLLQITHPYVKTSGAYRCLVCDTEFLFGEKFNRADVYVYSECEVIEEPTPSERNALQKSLYCSIERSDIMNAIRERTSWQDRVWTQ